jgi:hypothetical protein
MEGSMAAIGARRASTKTTGPRKPQRRRASAEDREIAEVSARIDRQLEELHARDDAVLRRLERRGGV